MGVKRESIILKFASFSRGVRHSGLIIDIWGSDLRALGQGTPQTKGCEWVLGNCLQGKLTTIFVGGWGAGGMVIGRSSDSLDHLVCNKTLPVNPR